VGKRTIKLHRGQVFGRVVSISSCPFFNMPTWPMLVGTLYLQKLMVIASCTHIITNSTNAAVKKIKIPFIIVPHHSTITTNRLTVAASIMPLLQRNKKERKNVTKKNEGSNNIFFQNTFYVRCLRKFVLKDTIIISNRNLFQKPFL